MYLPLPSDKKSLCQAIEDSVAAASSERNVALTEYYIIHYYLQGVRHFTVNDWEQGDMHIAYENYEDELTFRWEKVLSTYRVEFGRFMKLDLDAMCSAFGYGMDAVRKAGIGHATLKYMTSGINPHEQKARIIQMFLKYGTVGLRHYRCAGANLRDRTCLWDVPPWELLCYPAKIQTLGDQRGLFHERCVPLEWAKEQQGLTFPKDMNKLEAQDYGYGESPNQHELLDSNTSGGYFARGRDIYETGDSYSVSQNQPPEKTDQKWVKLTEAWMFGDRPDEVVQYAVKVGRHIARYEEFTRASGPVYCPIGIARHTETGRFYGRGFVGPQITLNDQVEKMLSRQFQIVSDMDEYGMLVIPTTAGLNRQEVLKRERRKVLMAEPDPTAPNYRPEAILPASSGDFPGKLANLGIDLHDMMAGQQGGIFQGDAPGRVDSASGLGFLFETSNVGLIGPSNSLANAYRTVYRSMLAVARQELEAKRLENPMAPVGLDLPLIDERMLGVVIDPQSGQMRLDQNPIPDPNEVIVDVADRSPSNKMQMVAEAKEHLDRGLLSEAEYQILNYRENLGLPMVDRSIWEAYRKAVFQTLLVFNDGVQPNPYVPMNTEADNPEVTLMVITSVMSSLEFMFASPEIRNAFEVWKEDLELGTGRRYPSGLPYPEETAQMAQQGPPQGPPPMSGPPPGAAGPLGLPPTPSMQGVR